MSGYTYIASPYSHPDAAVRDERYRQACHAAAYLMRQGKLVFSPIAHSHPVETIGLQTVESGSFWKRQDVPILRHASELIVLMIDGWMESAGIKWEVEIADSLNIPVSYLNPAGKW